MLIWHCRDLMYKLWGTGNVPTPCLPKESYSMLWISWVCFSWFYVTLLVEFELIVRPIWLIFISTVSYSGFKLFTKANLSSSVTSQNLDRACDPRSYCDYTFLCIKFTWSSFIHSGIFDTQSEYFVETGPKSRKPISDCNFSKLILSPIS